MVKSESVKQKEKMVESIKKTNVNHSFFNDLSNVFSKMKSDSEGWFLNYVQDD